jgi:hypothetical protein
MIRTPEERKRVEVHRALGCNWVYIRWVDKPHMMNPQSFYTDLVASYSDVDSHYRVCPVCGKFQTSGWPTKNWTRHHSRTTAHDRKCKAAAREFFYGLKTTGSSQSA